MRALFWTNRAVIAAAFVCVGPRLAVARPPRPPGRQPVRAVTADKPGPTGPAAKSPRAGSAARPAPVTLTAVGDQLVIAGDDPAAVARAYALARFILEDKGQVYRAFRLHYADATEVARVLDEWFNGLPKSQRPPAVNPLLAALALRGRGRRGGPPTPPPPPPEPPRIRIVPDPENNTILVRGTALDLISVQRVLESAIDIEPPDSQAARKPFVIGPLQYAVATEVVRVLKEVYQQDLDQATVRGARRAAFGRRPSQPLDPSGRPKPVTLTITADDRTNSIIGMAPGPIAADIKKVVGVLEDKARVDTKAVELVPAEGIDPTLLQSVLDAIQARPPAAAAQRPPAAPSPSRR